jgi:hypothetical protein
MEVDATEAVREALRRAERDGDGCLLVTVKASSCPGCDTLARQLAGVPGRLLRGKAGVVEVDAGDLVDGAADAVRIGGWTLKSPGFPTTWVWVTEPGRLRYLTVGLGPLPALEAEAAITAALAGAPFFPDEAEDAVLQACTGALCLPLRGRDSFRGSFAIRL